MFIGIPALVTHSVILLVIIRAEDIESALIFHAGGIGTEYIGRQGIGTIFGLERMVIGNDAIHSVTSA